MPESLSCFRCGASLHKLSPPLSQRDECPECAVHLHVCHMCRHFDPDVARKCREDDAEEVFEKEKMNFCEWFVPSSEAFDPARAARASQAKSALDELFDDSNESAPDNATTTQSAEDLFK